MNGRDTSSNDVDDKIAEQTEIEKDDNGTLTSKSDNIIKLSTKDVRF